MPLPPPPLPSPFGTLLRTYRLRAGLTQQRLADVLGMHYSYVSKIETGHAPLPDGDWIDRAVAALGLNPAEANILDTTATAYPRTRQRSSRGNPEPPPSRTIAPSQRGQEQRMEEQRMEEQRMEQPVQVFTLTLPGHTTATLHISGPMPTGDGLRLLMDFLDLIKAALAMRRAGAAEPPDAESCGATQTSPGAQDRPGVAAPCTM